MNILVTGGCGFIGSNLVDQLIQMGHTVKVIDNESNTNRQKFYYNTGATYYKLDISDYTSTRNLYDNIDIVFHMAAESSIQLSIVNPTQTIKTNILGTQNVLQCSREAGVKKVIYSSTCATYGLKNKSPLIEDMPNDCLNPYAVSKASGEELCKMYTNLFGLKTIIFRYFNVYGNRESNSGDYAPVIGLFLNLLKQNLPLTIVGDGNQQRDFTHVDDVVAANILAMEVDHDNYGEIYNIGSGSSYSVKQLADMISTDQIYLPARIGECRATLADTQKAKTILGWKPKVNINEYIKSKLNEKQENI